ncbi:hypothetical protein [Sphingomicrobium lutaoense]|uniref:Transmembrane protein n=1 Tax=Sphingomicrobium lutaoense TaxID=515949 RepID=A0A839YX82_9SPHN|nr:hypothetical protein [Sphingomicrobium lutaoense]MBB3763090.1 hypothetical protein [Sphingomicrobium lutaoense]
MTPEEQKWRHRAAIVQWMRIGGLLIALLGLLLMRGGVITDEPWPILGAVLLVSGLIDATLSPKIMKRLYDAEDRAQ